MAISIGSSTTDFITTLKRVFARPKYVLVSVVACVSLLLFVSLLPHVSLVSQILATPDLVIRQKLIFIGSLFTHLGGFVSGASLVLTLMSGVLFGVQSALLLFYIRHRRTTTRVTRRVGAASLTGLVAAMFGIGCAACGTVIVTTVLGLFGAAGALALLPFHGLEIAFLGVLILLWSIHYLARHINDPLVCDIA